MNNELLLKKKNRLVMGVEIMRQQADPITFLKKY